MAFPPRNIKTKKRGKFRYYIYVIYKSTYLKGAHRNIFRVFKIHFYADINILTGNKSRFDGIFNQMTKLKFTIDLSYNIIMYTFPYFGCIQCVWNTETANNISPYRYPTSLIIPFEFTWFLLQYNIILQYDTFKGIHSFFFYNFSLLF